MMASATVTSVQQKTLRDDNPQGLWVSGQKVGHTAQRAGMYSKAERQEAVDMYKYGKREATAVSGLGYSDRYTLRF